MDNTSTNSNLNRYINSLFIVFNVIVGITFMIKIIMNERKIPMEGNSNEYYVVQFLNRFLIFVLETFGFFNYWYLILFTGGFFFIYK